MVDVSLSATANNKREDAVQQSNKTIDCTTNSNAAIKDSNGSLNPLKSPAAAPQYTTPSYSSLASSTAINGQTSRHKLNNSSSTSNTKKPKNSKIVNDVYQWPVFMALIPPFLAFYYGGKVEEWSETFLLIIVGGYLYGLIKLPWELYVSAHLSLARHKEQSQQQQEQQQTSDNSLVYFRLWILEQLYFVLVFASPLGGALFLRYIRPHIRLHQNFINDFPMALYVLTAYIRPLIYLSRVLKGNIQSLAEEMNFPQTTVEEVKQKLAEIDERLCQLSALCHDTREQVQSQVADIVEHKFTPQLQQLSNNVRKTKKKLSERAEERLRELEEELWQQHQWIAEHKDEMERLQSSAKQRQRIILRPFYWLIDSVPQLSVSTFVFMPFHVAAAMTSWIIPLRLKTRLLGDGSDEQQQQQKQKRQSITAGPGFHSPNNNRSSVSNSDRDSDSFVRRS